MAGGHGQGCTFMPPLAIRSNILQWSLANLAMVQNQWYHFGIGAPPILVHFSGDWDVHWGYDSGFDPWPFRVGHGLTEPEPSIFAPRTRKDFRRLERAMGLSRAAAARRLVFAAPAVGAIVLALKARRGGCFACTLSLKRV